MNKAKHIFLTTFILLVAVFIIGMVIGRWMGSSGADEITTFIKNNELNTESYLIEQEFIENFESGKCDLANARISSLGTDLWKLGKALSQPNAEENLGSENFNFMKRSYHLMQIRTYTLMYKLNQNCNNTESVVLFYYGNNTESEEQGIILDRFVEEYKVHVFAIESEYSPELEFLEEYYEISKTPSLIIDFDTKIEGLSSYDKLKKTILK